MMVCMAGLQVFIVRFFFQVGPVADSWTTGREKGLRVNHWTFRWYGKRDSKTWSRGVFFNHLLPSLEYSL